MSEALNRIYDLRTIEEGSVAIKIRRRPLPFVLAILVVVLLIPGSRALTSWGGRLGSGNEAAKHAIKDCSGDPITLTLVASSEKAQLMKQLAVEYTATGHRVGGRCIKLVVSSITGAAKESDLPGA